MTEDCAIKEPYYNFLPEASRVEEGKHLYGI